MVGSGIRGFQQKLFRLKLYLKMWNNDVFANFFSRVKEAEEDIAQNERLYDLSSSTTDRAIFSEVRAQLQHALLCESFFFINSLLFVRFKKAILIPTSFMR